VELSKSNSHHVSSWAICKWSQIPFSSRRQWTTTILHSIRTLNDLSNISWKNGKHKNPRKITFIQSLSWFWSDSTLFVYPFCPISELSPMKMQSRRFSLDLFSTWLTNWTDPKPIVSKKSFLLSSPLKLSNTGMVGITLLKKLFPWSQKDCLL
jgi:hypothetical protein